jgi:hypothetical protein
MTLEADGNRLPDNTIVHLDYFVEELRFLSPALRNPGNPRTSGRIGQVGIADEIRIGQDRAAAQQGQGRAK